MSQEHVEAMKRLEGAGNRRDVNAVLAEPDDAVEWFDAAPMLLGGRTTVFDPVAVARLRPVLHARLCRTRRQAGLRRAGRALAPPGESHTGGPRPATAPRRRERGDAGRG